MDFRNRRYFTSLGAGDVDGLRLTTIQGILTIALSVAGYWLLVDFPDSNRKTVSNFKLNTLLLDLLSKALTSHRYIFLTPFVRCACWDLLTRPFIVEVLV